MSNRRAKPELLVASPRRKRGELGRLRLRISELEHAQRQSAAARETLEATAAALRESEERYALAMKGPNEGLWDWNAQTKELYLSARLLTILGFEGQTIRTTSHEWLEIVHPDDRTLYQRVLVNHLKGRADHFECEYRVRARDGGYRWVLARGLAVRDEHGAAHRMVGSLGDVTERKRREALVRASEARFRSLVDIAAGIIVVVSGDGRVLEFNREAERIIEIGSDLALGRLWVDLLGRGRVGLDGTSFQMWLDRARNGEQMRDLESLVGCHVVSWNLAPLDDEGCVVVVGQDITRKLEAERALRRANDLLEYRVAERTRDLETARRQAEEANRCKSEFLANMSHELRTPLNAVIGFSDVMRLQIMGPIENDKYQSYVNDIWESGTYLLGIINDLLDLSKAEAGRFDLCPEWVAVELLGKSVVRLMAEKAMRARLDLQLETIVDPGSIWADPLRMKQVLFNLLSNAVKFTPAGGDVRLIMGRDDDAVWIKVSDTGIGMDQSQINQAMEPFMQVESYLARKNVGTGLGLPLAKRFVEMHGGVLAVDSNPGKGTIVTIRLSTARPD